MQNQSELFSNVSRIIYSPSLCRPRQQCSETLVQTRRQEANRTETQTFEDVSKTTMTMWNQSKLNEAACRLFFFTDLEDKILTAKQQLSLAGDALTDESESPQCADNEAHE